MTENTRVVVIGGGYSGVMAANRLTQRSDVAVTLINPRPDFVERIRLHQLVGGSNDAAAEFGEVLAAGIHLVVDSVTRIETKEFVCRGTVNQLTREARKPGSLSWGWSKDAKRQLLLLQSKSDGAPTAAERVA
jgi:2-polyprenyl-6-methoxyphenol hydroxylase-like FAD-dependent oxidoreductase